MSAPGPTKPSRASAVPERWTGREPEHYRKIAQAVNDLQRGKGNNVFVVSLKPNATSTVVPVSFARQGTACVLAPETASAAASQLQVYAVAGNGEVTVNHDASPATDRVFRIVVNG